MPWKSPDNARKISPVETAVLYLKHLVDAWNHQVAKDVADHRLENQDIILTVPASFDAQARELLDGRRRPLGRARRRADAPGRAAVGVLRVDRRLQGRRGRGKQVDVGDVVLVCDVGGGTTDLSLIAVTVVAGNLTLTRVAVGDHILLGGDNMDLALAHHAAAALSAKGVKLDAGQMQMLWHSCRLAKETLFGTPDLASAPVTVLGRGSKVIGGTIKGELSRDEVETLLVDGFFPQCPAGTQPQRARTMGLQEIGLPYAADPAVSKHLAWFLARNDEVLNQTAGKKRKKKAGQPAAILFNGGVFKAQPLRSRLLEILNKWSKNDAGVKDLSGADLDRAVAAGAAYYGLVRRGKGLRIRGGTARSYYVGIESSLPAVPGAPPPLKALCVVPFGMEEGTETDVPAQEFGLIVGEPVEFRFLGSSVRRHDIVGTMVDEWQDEIGELAPVSTTFESAGNEGKTVPVHLHSKVTELGTLELWCISRDEKEKWKLEFNVRERGEEES